MADVEQTYQNGHRKVYTEENDDGTVTEYHEERYIIEGDDSKNTPDSSEVLVLQDDDDVKVYQQHEVLPDGREMITTTTITLDENGEATEETVTEIVESEEVEVEESDEEELEDEKQKQSEAQSDQPDQQTDQQVEPESEKVEVVTSICEFDDVTGESHEDIGELPAVSNTQSEDNAQSGRSLRRHLSYEEFEEQYTEYKPPKRYEKKQSDKAADKAAPRISIMTTESGDLPAESMTSLECPASVPDTAEPDTAEPGTATHNIECEAVPEAKAEPEVGPDEGETHDQGIPNSAHSTAPLTGDNQVTSPRSSSYGDGDSLSDELNSSQTTTQPTRTQGSVIRRMDQGANVDPANIVRAEDKPDLGAELPSVGTSKSLKDKFQSYENGPSKPIDFSQPPKREQSRKSHHAPAPVTSVDSESTHQVPEFEGGEIENTPHVRDDVVREADRNDSEELPEQGQARGLLSKWGQMEKESSQKKEYKPSGIGSKPTVTPLRPTSRVEVVNSEDYKEPEVEGGEYESTPVPRTDVVRATDVPSMEEELPSIGMAKSLRSQFQQRESDAKQVKDYKPSGAGNRAPRVQSRPTGVTSTEARAEPQFEGGEVENQPEVRADVVRESDRNDTEELPEQGYTKNLKARLRELQDQQRPVDYVEHRPSGVASKATPTPLGNRNSLNTSINSVSTCSDEADSRVEPQVEGGEYESQPIRRSDVIREEDRMDEEELPEAGLAKNLMNQFKTLESQKNESYKPSGIGNKPTPTPLRPVPASLDDTINEETPHAPPEGGAWESTPVKRSDVIRESDSTTEADLPTSGLTRNRQSQYDDIASSTTPEYKPSGVSLKPTPTPLRPTPTSLEELINETTPHAPPQGGAWESTPVKLIGVIRETDATPERHLPASGVTKNRQSQYDSIASKTRAEYKPSGVSLKSTPSKLHIMAGRSSYNAKGSAPENAPPVTDDTDNVETSRPLDGEFESTPMVRDDVVREDTRNDHAELPEQGIAKNIMSRFKSIENDNKSQVQHRPSKIASKPTPTPLRPKSAVSDVNDATSEASSPDHVEAEGGEYENTPEINHNVIRASDTNEHDYAPSAGAAKSLMDKFKQLENQKTDQVEHKPSKVASSLTPTPLQLKR